MEEFAERTDFNLFLLILDNLLFNLGISRCDITLGRWGQCLVFV